MFVAGFTRIAPHWARRQALASRAQAKVRPNQHPDKIVVGRTRRCRDEPRSARPTLSSPITRRSPAGTATRPQARNPQRRQTWSEAQPLRAKHSIRRPSWHAWAGRSSYRSNRKHRARAGDRRDGEAVHRQLTVLPASGSLGRSGSKVSNRPPRHGVETLVRWRHW